MSNQADQPREEAVELDHEAIGFTESLAIGLSSTAPAYSLAAVIGTLTVIVGVQAPAAMLASFVPMFLIAAAFYYLNRADQDAGTVFSWVTRTLGPWVGWIGGWAICTTGILVIGSLADVGARYFYVLVGWDSAAESKWAVIALAVAIIVVMTAICIIGTELSGRLQTVLTLAQVGILVVFALVALGKVYSGDAPEGSSRPQADWLSPFAIDGLSPLVSSLLLGVFIYWGWESAVNLTEETRGSSRVPGLAGVVSTLVLVVTYVLVTTAVIAYAGLELLAEYDDDEGIFGALASDVLGSPWDKLVVLAIVTSAVSSTQTTIIPSSRTSFSMARQSALPAVFASVHPRFRTPWFSTAAIAGARDRVVRPGQRPLGELPLRHALRPVADDRLLLRADGDRLRGLLPARAARLGPEPALHRDRAAHRGGDPDLPLRQGGDRPRGRRELLLRPVGARHGRAPRDRARVLPARGDPPRGLAIGRQRALLRQAAVRDRRARGGRREWRVFGSSAGSTR